MQRALDETHGKPLVVVDRRTQEKYVLVRSEEYDRLTHTTPPPEESDVPEGVRQSRAAFLRDFPALFADPKTRGRFVVYHRDKLVTVARNYRAANAETIRLDLPDGEHLIIEVSESSEQFERAAAEERELD